MTCAETQAHFLAAVSMARMQLIKLGTQWHVWSAEFVLWHVPDAHSQLEVCLRLSTLSLLCHFSSTIVVKVRSARFDPRDSQPSRVVTQTAQTAAAGFGGSRSVAPCSVAAASERGCGNIGKRSERPFCHAFDPSIHTTSETHKVTLLQTTSLTTPYSPPRRAK